MPQKVELHVTTGKGHKTSHYDPRQHRQLDEPHKEGPDTDADARAPKGATDDEATVAGLATTPRPRATETVGDHMPTCHQPTTGGRDEPRQLQESRKRRERIGKTGTDNPCDQASRDGSAAEAQM